MILLLCFALNLSNGVLAGSFYSSKGIGLWRYYASGQGSGMGGIGIALTDFLAINQLNPATRYPVSITRVSGDFAFAMTDLKTVAGSGSNSQALAAGFRLLVPISRKVTISSSLNQVSTVNFSVTETNNIDGNEYTRKINGEGGLNKLDLAMFYSPFNKLYLGASANFFFGQIRETWKVDYVSSDFINSKNLYATNLKGLNGTVGLVVKPVVKWNIGAIVTTQANLSGKTEKSYSFGVIDTVDNVKKTLPLMWGVGSTYQVNDWLLVGADYLTQNWGSVDKDANTNWEYCDSQYMAAGVEFTPTRRLNAGFFKRLSYRCGFHYNNLNFKDDNGDLIKEYAFAVGIGIPFFVDQGRVDIALEFGKRANLNVNPVEEKIVRILVNVIGGERWFVRRP